MKIIRTIVRFFLGAVYLIFGLNGLFEFLPMPPMPHDAHAFMSALGATGYMIYLLKFTEIAVAIALLSNRFVPLALVVIFPVSLNVLLFGLYLSPESLPLGGITFLANVYLLFSYMKYYKPMLKSKA